MVALALALPARPAGGKPPWKPLPPPDDSDCHAWCPAPNVCHEPESDSQTYCVPVAHAAAEADGYGCHAACDGGCVYLDSGWTCQPSQPQIYGLTTGRIREQPSTKADIEWGFEAGESFFLMERRGEWIDVGKGWVHHELLGWSFVPVPPLTPDHLGLEGWVVGYDPVAHTVHELVDRGNGAAVSYPVVSLCSWPLDGGPTPPCLSAQPNPNIFASLPREDHAAFLWNDKGLDVQKRLQGSQAGRPTTTTLAAVGITARTDPQGSLQQLLDGDTVLWTSSNAHQRASVARVLLFETRWLVVVVEEAEPTGECCDAVERVVLDLEERKMQETGLEPASPE